MVSETKGGIKMIENLVERSALITETSALGKLSRGMAIFYANLKMELTRPLTLEEKKYVGQVVFNSRIPDYQLPNDM